ncbi:MAG: nucleoside recognition domain-containing protein [Chloroflexota bacterium]|nr:nucleoside recognition domain-containing protein [Chloroflexota bacterium]
MAYLIGIVVAIVLGVVLKNSLFKSAGQTPFVMELPPYRMPTVKGIWRSMWQRTGSFIRKAWTIILAVAIVLWILMAIPVSGDGGFGDADVSDSLFATVSSAVAPIFAPLGYDSWQASSSLITGFVAKEVVISTMSQVYGAELPEEPPEPTTFLQDVGEIITSFVQATIDTVKSIPLIVGIDLFGEEVEEEPTALMQAIHFDFARSSGGHAALAGLSFMIFVLLYTPCMVAVAAARHEFGARWMLTSVIGQFVLAWAIAFLVFQGGILLGLG